MSEAPTRELLEEEREFLLRSLDDLDGERAEGNIDDETYERLRADYTARAARVLRELDGQPLASDTDAVDPAPRTSTARRLVTAGGIVAFVVLVGDRTRLRARGAAARPDDHRAPDPRGSECDPAAPRPARRRGARPGRPGGAPGAGPRVDGDRRCGGAQGVPGRGQARPAQPRAVRVQRLADPTAGLPRRRVDADRQGHRARATTMPTPGSSRASSCCGTSPTRRAPSPSSSATLSPRRSRRSHLRCVPCSRKR